MKKSDISFEDKINELRLDFSNPQTKNKFFVLVEGESDVRLYRKLYSNPLFKIEVLPNNGKLFLEKGLQILSPFFRRLIGIRDADFCHLENQKPLIENLFFTDFHDSEMLIICSEPTFRAVMHEFSTLPASEHDPIRQKILHALRFVSYLRWYNELNICGFKFKGIKMGDIFEIHSFRIDHKKYIEKILERSENIQNTDIEHLTQDVNNLENQIHQLEQLCNGHDFMELLALFINSINQEGINAKNLTSHFRTAYTFEEFEKTNLHQQIHQWCIRNQFTINYKN